MNALVGALFVLVTGALQLDVRPAECWPSWFDEQALRTMLRAESTLQRDMRVSVRVERCSEAPVWFEVAVTNAEGGVRTERVSVDGSPYGLRLRILALIISEQTGPAVHAPSRRLAWTAGGSARSFFDFGAPLWGGQVGASYRATPWLMADAELTAEVGRVEADLGAVQHRLLGARLAPTLVLHDAPTVRLGPEIEVGWSMAEPTAAIEGAVERSLSASFASTGGRAAVEWTLSSGWLIRVDAAVGMTWGGVRAQVAGQPVAGIAGPYVRGGLLIGRRH